MASFSLASPPMSSRSAETSTRRTGKLGRMFKLWATLLLGLGCAALGAASAQTLRYGMVEMPRSQGNPFMQLGPSGTMIWAGLFDALTVLEEDGSLQPALATSWRQENDLTWSFTLRRGVTFSDGTPFEAEAVVATFKWLASSAGQATEVGPEFAHLAQVEAISPHEIRVRLKRADAILPVRMSVASIVEPRRWAALGPDGFAKQPVGTGSFVVETWPGLGKPLTAKVVPTSWRPPHVNELVVTVIPQAVSRAQALVTGLVDVVESIAFDDIDGLRAAGAHVMASPTSQVMSLGFINVSRPTTPLADVRVRQALNYAVDKKTIALALTNGLTTPTAQAAIPGMAGYNPAVTPYPYDPDKARLLLAEAGYPDGFSLNIEVVVGGFVPADAAIYQKAAEDLRAVGIDVTLNALPIQLYYEKFISGEWGDVNAIGASYQGRPYGDPLRAMTLASCLKPGAYFCDSGVVPLLEAAESAPSPGERTALLQKLAVRYKEIAPTLFLVAQAEVIGVSPDLGNVRRRNRTLVLHDITKSE